jgi:hypothetical protein
MWHKLKRNIEHREFRWTNQKESSCLEEPDVGGKIYDKMDYTEIG